MRDRVHALLLKAHGRNNGRLTSSAASECLLNAGLGLRFVQVHAVMSVVEEGEDGLMEAMEVANAVAGVMCALKQLHTRQHANKDDETVNVFKTSRQTEGLAKVAGLDADEFKVRRKERGRGSREAVSTEWIARTASELGGTARVTLTRDVFNWPVVRTNRQGLRLQAMVLLE